MKKVTFRNLVALARNEPHPDVHVADDVISTLTDMGNRKFDPYRAYAWIGTASASIAAGITIALIISWQSNANSVSEIITYVSWVAQ